MRIREPDLVQRILKTLLPARGDESQVPVDLDETQVLAVLDLGRFLPATEQTIGAAPTGAAISEVGLASGELYAHGNPLRSSGAGAGQKSGVGVLYAGIANTTIMNVGQIIGFWAQPDIASFLRTYTWSLSGVRDVGAGDARNTITGLAPERLGFLNWVSQTATPDVVTLPNWGSSVRMHLIPMLANQVYVWPADASLALAGRNYGGGIVDAGAFGWGVWGQADNTALFLAYGVIIRQSPSP